jgi:hypothetical protein
MATWGVSRLTRATLDDVDPDVQEQLRSSYETAMVTFRDGMRRQVLAILRP